MPPGTYFIRLLTKSDFLFFFILGCKYTRIAAGEYLRYRTSGINKMSPIATIIDVNISLDQVLSYTPSDGCQ